MRNIKNKILIGIVMTILLPIKNKNENRQEIITHGCTTFLNVHPKIRNHGMCMALIRRLIENGYQKNIYCSYHTVPFKLGNNSILLTSWYRPINIKKCTDIGFLFPGYDDKKMYTRNRLRYKNKIPKNVSYKKVDANNIEESFEVYQKFIQNKKFVFFPDIKLWKLWINLFPTYIIYKNKEQTGILSVNSLTCKVKTTQKEGKIITPIICNGDTKSILSVLTYIGQKENYDVAYFYQYGDITTENMKIMNCIKTNDKMWFSLYNNNIKLNIEDISVPFF